jgi:hypothetical protein
MQRTGGVGFVMAIALGLTAAPAMAVSHHHPRRVSALGGTCIGSASAIAQYCELIPGAGGGHHPGPGTPTLSATLPSGAVSQLEGSPTLRPLLRIPAAGGGHGVRSGAGAAASGAPATLGSAFAGHSSSVGSSGTDAASVWSPMVLVLAGIALLLGGLEIVRRRRFSGRLG